MGCVTATAKRRRRQAVNRYMHLAPQVRPRYKMRSVEMQNRRLADVVKRERERQQRKGGKK